MKLTGTWPKKERLTREPTDHPQGKFVLLATDRHRCGQPIRAVTECGYHLTDEIPGKRFVRFQTREEGEQWKYDNRDNLKMLKYIYTVATL